MNETIKRLKSESPKYFKRIRKAALIIGASAIAMLTIDTSLALNMPEILITICKYAIFICAGIAGTATLTKI